MWFILDCIRPTASFPLLLRHCSHTVRLFYTVSENDLLLESVPNSTGLVWIGGGDNPNAVFFFQAQKCVYIGERLEKKKCLKKTTIIFTIAQLYERLIELHV